MEGARAPFGTIRPLAYLEIRLLRGSGDRYLILGSALPGAMVLTVADIAARMLLRPAELPIGILTSALGAPLFVALPCSRRERFDSCCARRTSPSRRRGAGWSMGSRSASSPVNST